MYKKDYYIHTYEVDEFKKLTPIALLRYLQDVMVHNADSYGASDDAHIMEDDIWVLIDYEINITRYPKGKQYVSCETLPYSFKKVYGYRIWNAYDEFNEKFVEAKGKFILINSKTKSITTPSDELIALFKDAKSEPIALPFSKIRIPKKDPDFVYKEMIKYSYIDINHHTNNVEYFQLAFNTIPTDILQKHDVSNIKINFKKESMVGDYITICRYDEDLNYFFELYNKDVLITQIQITLNKEEHQL